MLMVLGESMLLDKSAPITKLDESLTDNQRYCKTWLSGQN